MKAYEEKLLAILKQDGDQTILQCVLCDFVLRPPSQCILSFWSVYEDMESHFNENHGIQPTKELILRYLQNQKVLRGKERIMRKIIDDLGLQFFRWDRFGKSIRYNTDVAKIFNSLLNDGILESEKKGNEYFYYFKR